MTFHGGGCLMFLYLGSSFHLFFSFLTISYLQSYIHIIISKQGNYNPMV
jgi:hypothetical protein